MGEKDEEKYFGEIISKDGRNLKNIKARICKRKGIVRKIMAILESILFGNHIFKWQDFSGIVCSPVATVKPGTILKKLN